MKAKLLLGALLICLVGCGTKPKSTSGQLRINFTDNPPTIDPRRTGDVISACVDFMLYSGLTRMDESSPHTPTMAKQIEISEDQRCYTFHLGECFWSDGSRVTSHDFERTWKEVLSPEFPAPNAHLFFCIENAEMAKRGQVPLSEVGLNCPDESTLVVRLKEPTPYFLDLTSYCSFYPVKDTGDYLLSNGPFRVKEWVQGDYLLLEQNPHYFMKDHVQLDSIYISIVKSESTALQMYERGELDIIANPITPLPIDAVQALSKEGRVMCEPIASTTMCTYNTKRFPFNNAKLRKAFHLATNRDEIAENIDHFKETPATRYIPPLLNSSKPPKGVKKLDARCARILLEEGLEELGLEKHDLDGIKLLYTTSSEFHKQLAQVLQQQWKKYLDVEIAIEGFEFAIYVDKLYRKEFQFAQCKWVSQYPDAMSVFDRFVDRHNPQNHTGWESAKFKSLVEASMCERSTDQRLKLLNQAEEIILDEAPITPICHHNLFFLQRPNLKGVYLSPIGTFHFWKARFEEEA